jgi:hypothetical protein
MGIISVLNCHHMLLTSFVGKMQTESSTQTSILAGDGLRSSR